MFGQVVVGPPGSGKTTYCAAMYRILRNELSRPVFFVNLDPAADPIPNSPNVDIDISELIRLEDVMDHLGLGPNGGLVYCIEFLEKNIDWLVNKLNRLPQNKYVLFDCPGQVELYTHNEAMRHILDVLCERMNHRLVAVHLVDSHYCSDAGKFVSVLVEALSSMMHLGMPHINILSKVDLIESHGQLPFGLDFFTEVLDLSCLLDTLNDDPFFSKYKRLNKALIGLVEDRSLVSFLLLESSKSDSLLRVLREADRACGYVFGSGEDRNMEKLLSKAIGAEYEADKLGVVSEEYMDQS